MESACEVIPEERKAAIRQQLARIVQSEFFRSSQRCCRFLQYCVERSLNGHPAGEMKERTIGIEVFHRLADYDTAQDNVVRITANEVRKRLAQYYGRPGASENPVLGLSAGSYVVTFEWKHEAPAPESPAVPEREPQATLSPAPGVRADRNNFGYWARRLLIVAALMALTFFAVSWGFHRADVVQNVWSPLLDNPSPILICISQPPGYLPSPQGDATPQTQFVLAKDAFVGVGDAYALASISNFLSSRGKRWRLLAGDETPSSDLKSGPVVLIGAFSNPWSARLIENLRFSFGPDNVLFDRQQPGKEWRLRNLSPDWHTGEDYAIVSRFLSPETGEPVLLVAGITNLGTQAAGEFVTDPEQLAAALRQAPSDWKKKNFQFILHTKVIGKTPERPTILVTHFW